MKKIFVLITATALCITAGAQVRQSVRTESQNPAYARQYIELIASGEPLRSAAWGMKAITAGGDTLVDYMSMQKLVPASNTKLISTGLAMDALGAGYQFKTSIGYTGEIDAEGNLHGDLYIIGGGDPTLASRDSIATYIDSIFAEWMKALKSAGVKHIDGRIIGDGRFFEGMPDRNSWNWEDLGTYYGTGGNGLCFYRNVKDWQATAGPSIGSPVKFVEGYPDTPWMSVSFPCTTGEKGIGDQLYLYTSELAPIAEMRGSFGIDRASKKVECSNKYGAMTCALYFSRYLAKYGIEASGGYADVDTYGTIREDLRTGKTGGKAASTEDMTIVKTTLSPSLKRISRITNYRSDNFYAETILRILGKEKTGSALYDSCLVAQSEAFERIGVDDSYGARFVDGSGLSRENYVSADFMCRYLRAMMDRPVFGDWVETLLQPGYNSYETRLSGESKALKDRIYMKSGSMDGVRCYSGYIMPTDGAKEDTIIFSILTNTCDAPTWKVAGIIDNIIAMLAHQN